jgi:hypothetical protein
MIRVRAFGVGAILALVLLVASLAITQLQHPSLLVSASARGSLSREGQNRLIDRAISAIEEALEAIQEIQTTEDLEEAQDLAEDAEQDLREAISILKDIEIPNWLYLPEQGALYWHGPILDQQTKQPVTADIFVNGRWVARAQEVQFLMWATEEEPVWVEVRAEGYKPWELRFRFRLRKLEVIEGPVWLVRQG